MKVRGPHQCVCCFSCFRMTSPLLNTHAHHINPHTVPLHPVRKNSKNSSLRKTEREWMNEDERERESDRASEATERERTCCVNISPAHEWDFPRFVIPVFGLTETEDEWISVWEKERGNEWGRASGGRGYKGGRVLLIIKTSSCEVGWVILGVQCCRSKCPVRFGSFFVWSGLITANKEVLYILGCNDRQIDNLTWAMLVEEYLQLQTDCNTHRGQRSTES